MPSYKAIVEDYVRALEATDFALRISNLEFLLHVVFR
jgi:hypothetical protein